MWVGMGSFGHGSSSITVGICDFKGVFDIRGRKIRKEEWLVPPCDIGFGLFN